MENLELLIQAAISVTGSSKDVKNIKIEPYHHDNNMTKSSEMIMMKEETIQDEKNSKRQHENTIPNDDTSNDHNKRTCIRQHQGHSSSTSPSKHHHKPFTSFYPDNNHPNPFNLSLQAKRDIFTSIMDNFNMNDVPKFQSILQRFAKESVIISSKSLRCESIGFPSLLIFWVLILEGYPDAVINNIVPKEISRNCCEFSFHFVGTRITAHPVTMLYSLAVDKLALGATVTSAELLSLVTRSSLDSSFCAPTCPFVSCKGRAILTYDYDGKISRWFFDMKV